MRNRGFWRELKRRHVYRVAAAYVIVGWLLIQVVTQVFPIFHLPDWVDQAIVLLILVGFPIALVLAWAFDATPHGIVRTDASPAGDGAGTSTRRPSRRAGIAVGSIGVLIAIAAGAAWWHAGHGNTSASRDAHMASAKPVAATPAASGLTTINGSASTPQGIPTSPIAAQTIPAKSIAVLPFENLSTDKGNAYFADGMQDLILTKLADIGDLKVISRTSTMQYGSHPQNLKVIAQQLGVATILEGSVQKASNQVLINVQLIDANTDSHIWAEAYPRTLDNIFGVEGEVAQKVADALKAKLSPAQSHVVAVVPTHNPQAYDAYLRAKHYQDIDNDSLSGGSKAIASFQQAVALDPKFALAWAGLAWAQYWAYRDDHQPATLREAEKNARHALWLEPDLPEAHIAMSVIDLYALHDTQGAHAHAQRALDLRPNYAYAYRLLGDVDQSEGDFAAGAKQMQRALALKPNDHVLADLVGMAQGFIGDYAGARRALHQALAIAPNDQFAYLMLSRLDLLDSGDIDAALKVLNSIPAAAPKNADVAAWRVRLLLMQRNYAAASQVVAGLPDASKGENVAVTHLRADIEYAAGGTDKARPYLLKLDARFRRLQHEPDMRAQPNFHATWALVLAKLGRKDEAVRQADIAKRLAGKGDSFSFYAYQLASAQVVVGENDAAIATLQKFMATPGHQLNVSPAMLKADPVWDPIRHNPAFQVLLKKYENAQPANGLSGAAQ